MSTPENAQVSLAPAAGAGIGKQVAENLLARPGFAERVADALDRALSASKRLWDKEAGADGKGGWVTEQDTRCQLQAVFGIFAHFEGMPIQRIIRENIGTAAGFDLDAELRANPALAEGLRRKLENAEWRKSGRNAKRVKPAEPEAEPDAAKA